MVDETLHRWQRFTLPEHEMGTWAVWRRGRVISCDGFEALRDRHARGWVPQASTLFAAPEAPRFQPPTALPAFRQAAMTSTRRALDWITVFLAVPAIALVAGSVLVGSGDAFVFGLSLLLMAAALLRDAHQVLASEANVAERALYFCWLYTDRGVRRGLQLWLAMAVAMGTLQLGVQIVLGGMRPAFELYGVMYPDVRAGELWRLVTGPFLHYSLSHFLVNAMLLVLAGTVAWGALSVRALLVFLTGSIVAAAAQMTLGGTLYDNMGGISGGLFALLGMLVALELGAPKALPTGMASVLAALTVANALASEAFSESTATMAHVAGIAWGLVVGAGVRLQARRRPTRQA